MNFTEIIDHIIFIPLALLTLIFLGCTTYALVVGIIYTFKFEKEIKKMEIPDDTRRMDFISREGVEILTESEEAGKPGEKIRVPMFRLNCNGTAGSPHFDVRRAIDEMMEIKSEKYLASL